MQVSSFPSSRRPRALASFAATATLAAGASAQVLFEDAKLYASDGGPGGVFGGSVAVSGDRAIVGTWNDTDAGPSDGTAYVFERGPDGWTEQAKLFPSDGHPADWFGWSVAISGDRAIVGSPLHYQSRAYVFELTTSGWKETAKLFPSDGPVFEFGWSVSVSGDMAIVGVPGASDAAFSAGAAYVYERASSGWVE